jgi:hypothetical protein
MKAIESPKFSGLDSGTCVIDGFVANRLPSRFGKAGFFLRLRRAGRQARARRKENCNEPVRRFRAAGRAGWRRDDPVAAATRQRGSAGDWCHADDPDGKATRPHTHAQDADGKGLGAPGRRRVAAPGLKVNAFATGLKHPRWINVLPNGDVTVAEALFLPGPIKSVFDYAMVSTMRRAAAVGVSPNRITLLRDANGDGVAETREAFLEGLSQPFGMALLGDTFYVGNTDGVVAFPYTSGATPHHRAGAQADRVQAWRALDAQPAAECGWAEAFRRRGLVQQYRRARLGYRGGPSLYLRTRSGHRQQPRLRLRSAQSRGPRMGAANRKAMDGS